KRRSSAVAGSPSQIAHAAPTARSFLRELVGNKSTAYRLEGAVFWPWRNVCSVFFFNPPNCDVVRVDVKRRNAKALVMRNSDSVIRTDGSSPVFRTLDEFRIALTEQKKRSKHKP